ncbi:unnamed protein product [Blepharisma stoltei]|uniref:Uncharacterized protein n=1 Tax=Blepharisma stoltei TaxID=1481888 RepID=A0AAU9JPN5_9CILI|nr:unnamed protein product [Blepharisma stoltei]
MKKRDTNKLGSITARMAILDSKPTTPLTARNLPLAISDTPKRVNLYKSNIFIPFVHERGSTGKLLSSRFLVPENTPRTNLEPGSLPKTPKKAPFLSSSLKTLPRTKAKWKIPEVGYYNPKPAYEMGHTKSMQFLSTPTYRTKISKRNVLSTDLMDMDEIHQRFFKHIKAPSLDKQLSRERQEENNELDEFLKWPPLELPEHLKRFKGMYHLGEFAKNEIYEMPKNFMDVAKEINENINLHMKELKEIQKQMKRKDL